MPSLKVSPRESPFDFCFILFFFLNQDSACKMMVDFSLCVAFTPISTTEVIQMYVYAADVHRVSAFPEDGAREEQQTRSRVWTQRPCPGLGTCPSAPCSLERALDSGDPPGVTCSPLPWTGRDGCFAPGGLSRHLRSVSFLGHEIRFHFNFK